MKDEPEFTKFDTDSQIVGGVSFLYLRPGFSLFPLINENGCCVVQTAAKKQQ